MKRQLTALGLCFALLGASSLVLAQSSAAREAALILRILSYDSTLRSRAQGGKVTVLVTYEPNDSSSRAARSRIVRALNALGRRTTVANMPARAVDHPFAGPGDLLAAARSAGAAAIYVAPGLESQVSTIANVTRRANLLSLTPVESNVRRGLAVGMVGSGSRTRLLINLDAVRSEGASLDAAVLRLAEVIR
jgi:hypothetical protein